MQPCHGQKTRHLTNKYGKSQREVVQLCEKVTSLAAAVSASLTSSDRQVRRGEFTAPAASEVSIKHTHCKNY